MCGDRNVFAGFIVFTSILFVWLTGKPAMAFAEPAAVPGCQSVVDLKRNPESCHGSHVLLRGRVENITRTDKYTRFYLIEGIHRLRFFNFGDAFKDFAVRPGDCVEVEGTFYFRPSPGKSGRDEGEVRWEHIRPCGSSSLVNDRWAWLQYVVLGAVVAVLIGFAARTLRRNQRRRSGKVFEDYVASLFGDQTWELEDRSSDTAYKLGRRIEGDSAYDWIIRHRTSGRHFVIECKYRSRFIDHAGHESVWVAEPWRLGRYRDYQRKKGYDYFVVIGVGGTPSGPRYMYLVPLDKLRYEFMWRESLNRFARDPQMGFMLGPGGELQ